MIKLTRMIVAALLCSALAACYEASVENSTVSLDTPVSSSPEASAPTDSASIAPQPPAAAAPPAASAPPAAAAPPAASAPPTAATPPAVLVPLPADQSATSADKPVALASAQGFTGLRVQATADNGVMQADGVGAFRLQCGYSHMAFDDPIVYPGKPGVSHLHTFFGNTSTDGNSTTETLSAASSSTCAGGIANRSAYWVPAMVDMSTSRAQRPTSNLIYYKSGYNANSLGSLQAPPNGLRLVAGNKVTQSTALESWAVHHTFECWVGEQRSGTEQYIPDCPVGGTILSTLDFPNCWDGVNLDSVDHRSHMAYSGGGKCPTSHPVAIPVVSLNVNYSVAAGQSTKNWRLSSDAYSNGSGGYSMHGDVWFNWEEDIKSAWMNNCVKAGRDCHAFLIGNNKTLY